MKKYFLKSAMIALLLSISTAIFSQNIAINNTGAAPNSSAILDINSTNLGVLFPSMSTAQRNAMTYPVAVGLLIFNSSTKCFEFNSTGLTTGWNTFACPCTVAPGTPSVPSSLSICTGSTTTTITANSSSATTYNWTATGFTFTGQGSATITLTVLPAVGSYTITVSATNPCGTSLAAQIAVTIVPLHGSKTFTWNGPDADYDGTVQTWAIPACVSSITVTAVGGGGGNAFGGGQGGKGASLTGTLAVPSGDVLDIMVAGQGLDNNFNGGGGGGGGSFVWNNNTGVLLVAAGGGGGAGWFGNDGANGQTTNTTATTLETPTNSTGGNGAGGSGGNGGGAGTNTNYDPGCGGAGWSQDGSPVIGGNAPYTGFGIYPEAGSNPGFGGEDANGQYRNPGGFGGGAGGGGNGGGGGGGYNGGGGGNGFNCGFFCSQGYGGGGGGSYFNGTIATSTTTGTVNTNGSVTITW